ncbi:hypothetical protein GCM10010149_25770 [Nonomuraea roseoviolacea subsp. roseoviolacea]
MLEDAAHGAGVQALHEERAQAADEKDRLPHHPPGHRTGAEKAMIRHKWAVTQVWRGLCHFIR